MDKKIKRISEASVDSELSKLSTSIRAEIFRGMDRAEMDRADLARTLGCSRSSVTQLLDGDRNLTLRKLAHLGLALGIEWKIEPWSWAAALGNRLYIVKGQAADIQIPGKQEVESDDERLIA